ncbi:hypothetical protein ACFVRU_47640 [Streptomyces sp. NPDC057927]|uniref:hypothetical protein n=1 Tax=Streptomyces sp. WAC00263 TaxID=1917422 RepID=UPI00321FC2AD
MRDRILFTRQREGLPGEVAGLIRGEAEHVQNHLGHCACDLVTVELGLVAPQLQ